MALKLLSVSFLGVSFLRSGRLGRESGARLGGVHTGAGEKQLVRVGGNLSAGTLIEGSKEKMLVTGRWVEVAAVAGRVARLGNVLLLPKSGFATCGGGTHTGTNDAEVKEAVREDGSVCTKVVAVDGRDEDTLMIDDRFDEMVDVSDGRMMGERPGEGSSTVIT